MPFFRSLYLAPRLFVLLGINAGLFVLAFMLPVVFGVAQVALLLISLFLGLDLLLMYGGKGRVEASRELPDKLSNGDPNPVALEVTHSYPFELTLDLVDEAPPEFQLRNQTIRLALPAGERRELTYTLRPVERGEYDFGDLHLYARSLLGLVIRRFSMPLAGTVPCYPSYIQMRQYQLLAISNRLTEMGVKKIRRLGHTTEFEQIKEYVRGDDYRTVNWKATARSGKLMVNQYTDARSQNVYCLVDKSRAMKMPFEGMSLLDYAINAALVLSNIAIYKQDKGGLITFAERVDATVPASSKATQMNRIMEVLYKQETRFLEADYGRLFAYLKRQVPQRSLLVLFTNFESLTALRRQLPYFQRMARSHLLLVILFENTELHELLDSQPDTTEDIYIKGIGEHFSLEKRLIVRELEQHGIPAILTPPEQLTVHTVNKYLEMKARGMI
ncbi:MAG: DUF58 domain-containing protein [Bacteroidetes bacterium]|nr:MAG: DUF58 domain-containing protein [Bacteroidota bacterium]